MDYSDQDAIIFFQNHIAVAENCWLWTGFFDRKNLPIIRLVSNELYPNGKPKYKEYSARKLSLHLADREFNHQSTITCGNSLCVNPDHLITTVEEKFWSKVIITEGCWNYQGQRDKDDYGKLKIGKKTTQAHRYSYELHFGTIQNTLLIVCHTCDNPPCVNPEHLYLGTHKDNARDRNTRNRAYIANGELCNFAKLREFQIPIIRKLYDNGFTMNEIAIRFEVHPATIRSIVNRINWKHVP